MVTRMKLSDNFLRSVRVRVKFMKQFLRNLDFMFKLQETSCINALICCFVLNLSVVCSAMLYTCLMLMVVTHL